MIHFKELITDKDYWYIFIPSSAINLQTVKLEKVHLESVDEDGFNFRVYRSDISDDFLTVNINVDHIEGDEYPNIFPINKKDDAQQYWAKEFFKNFKDVNGVDFSHFVKLYKKIQEEHPEWII